MLWTEDVHMCKRVMKSIAATGSPISPFEIFYTGRPMIIGSLSELRYILYITK